MEEKRRAPAPLDDDTAVPFLQPKPAVESPMPVESVSNKIKGEGLEGLVTEYYNITTDEMCGCGVDSTLRRYDN
ncbi:unnamed protein product, partial [Aphanomyces euteiches]